jgi:predicted TIM-barrel fold metal-dependent hydrolase
MFNARTSRILFKHNGDGVAPSFWRKTILQWYVDKISVKFQQIKFVLGHKVLIEGLFLPFRIIDNGLIMTKMLERRCQSLG